MDWRKVLLAKSDFEIWAFKGFLYLDKKISPKKGLEVSTPKNLKWKKYIRQSKNANGSPLQPLWGSQKIKVRTKRTLRPKNLQFCFGEKSSWCSCLHQEDFSPEQKWTTFTKIYTIRTFLQTKNKAPLGLFSFFRSKASESIFRVKKCLYTTTDWFRW